MRQSTFIAIGVLIFSQMPSVGQTIIVKQGETLSEIAEEHKVSLKKLMKENNLNDANQIWSGQELSLPKKAPANSSQNVISKQRIHIVSQGETLGSISIKYQIKPFLYKVQLKPDL